MYHHLSPTKRINKFYNIIHANSSFDILRIIILNVIVLSSYSDDGYEH